MKKKILYFDIETRAEVQERWTYWSDGPPLRVLRDWEILSMSWKWGKRGKVQSIARIDYKNFSELELAKDAKAILDEADMWCAHNGAKFDIRKLNAKFVQYRLGPFSPMPGIDTKKEFAKHAAFSSNKLAEICRVLGIGGKLRTGGYDLWADCSDYLDGKLSKKEGLKQWDKMIRYCNQDVRLLPHAHDWIRPFITNHPRMSDKPDSCANCGSTRLRSHGWHTTKTSAYRRFKCQDCGAYSRARKADKDVEKPSIVSL